MMENNADFRLPDAGPIVLFGSGETSPTGRKIFDQIFQRLPLSPRLALLETPAGFELNSSQVIGRVGDFFSHRLQNYAPRIDIISARRRGTIYSPDNPSIVSPLLVADLIFMGPGSPTYAIRQLRDSLAWHYLIARHRLGCVLALASAATVAFSASALPVYEIYKVGEDIHWIEGLDFFKLYGLNLVFIPHWNNHEGGAELDTSRCFMGQHRFARLVDMLPEDMTIIGLDEKTALVMNPINCECEVMGLGSITLIHAGPQHPHADYLHSSTRGKKEGLLVDEALAGVIAQRGGHIHCYRDGDIFPMADIGHFHPYQLEASLPQSIWEKVIQANNNNVKRNVMPPSEEILKLIQDRDAARQAKNWVEADKIRRQVEKLGWQIIDTKTGSSKILPKVNHSN